MNENPVPVINVPLLRNIIPIRDEKGEGVWFNLDTLVEFLKRHHQKSDKIKSIRRNNLQAEFQGHINGTKVINGYEHVSITSLLRYLFHHFDQQLVCREIVLQIQNKLYQETDLTTTTVDVIYKKVASTSFRNSSLENYVLNNAVISEESISSLCIEYKDRFSSLEWNKICVFEHHFSKQLKSLITTYTYEELIKLRLEFLHELSEVKEISSVLLHASRNTISERTQRKNAASEQEDVQYHINMIHSPKTIEVQAMSDFFEAIISSVICIDCYKSCRHAKSIHLFVELQKENLDEVDDISLGLSNLLLTKHDLNCYEIVFFKPGTFLDYIDKFGRPCRYRFRDDLTRGKHSNNILHHWFNSSENNGDFESTEERCSSCYGTCITKPLSWKSFDILTEWTLDVPLPMQMIFEKFINENTLKRTDDLPNFIRSKLTKLYTTYDVLLNNINRKYCGVLQDLNSQELSLNYESISTVFSVTSGAGATLSLNESEHRLKEMANEDFCHYTTYFRKYNLTYQTDAGLVNNKVSLQDCFLILLMDNLVRLKFRSDPVPSESRAKQICTLPITLKGLPRDGAELNTWHTPLCDTSQSCECKKDIQLNREDFEKKLTTLLPEEYDAMCKFKMLSAWGFQMLWQSFIEDRNSQNYLRPAYDNETSILEVSLASMHLSDEGEKDLDETIDYELGDNNTKLSTFDDQLSDIDCSSGEENFENTSDSYNSESDAANDRGSAYDSDGIESEPEDIENEDSGLENILSNVELLEINEIDRFESDIEMESFQPLNHSIEELNIADNESGTSEPITERTENSAATFEQNETEEEIRVSKNVLEDLKFSKYSPPPLITRHPPPATGRDDEESNIRRVLDDIILKSDHAEANDITNNKILFAPDNKIGKILLKLMSQSKKYHIFLPEFPLLHLRKSKINTLCSAYSNAGIVHILKYMRDDEYKEWKKLISDHHIEQATKYIRRLSLALHLAFSCTFIQTLSQDKADHILGQLAIGILPDENYQQEYDEFIKSGCKNNATFGLHKDIMDHCDEVSAIALSERLGGNRGYSLLLSAVKLSLPFAFLNGASSYASYCTDMLYHHMKSGPFYQNMKAALYTTPHKGSQANIALDAQREMDHKDVLKGFRTGSTMSSILPRMSLIDSLNEATDIKKKDPRKTKENDEINLLGLSVTATDIQYITRVALLILRQNALKSTQDSIPYNVYANPSHPLPESILDGNTHEVGLFLIKKYIVTSGLFPSNSEDMPDASSLKGPKILVQKVKKSKGVTVKRVTSINVKPVKTDKEKKEEKRKKTVKRETKKLEGFSSEMNACQAILKPDCTKPKVQKASGIQKAVIDLLIKSLRMIHEDADNTVCVEMLKNDIVNTGVKVVPESLQKTATKATVEFAGVKFKAKVFSGDQYLEFVQNNVVLKLLQQMPKLNEIVICEEKYLFTPDDFKAATRKQRITSKGISHLKTIDEMLSSHKFDKSSLVSSSEGKSFISKYLAMNANKMNLKRDVSIVIDSELHVDGCTCKMSDCKCGRYSIPIRCEYSKEQGLKNITKLDNIKQNKGEAEMAQVDWLLDFSKNIQDQGCYISVVSSGDIDAIVIHLFSLSLLWPRSSNGKFKNQVYVILQKPNAVMDIYNITKIIEILELAWKDEHISAKVAIGLSLGGNDFLPKFHGISHSRTLEVFFLPDFLNNMIKVKKEENGHYSIQLDTTFYINFIKSLYCPKYLNSSIFTFDEVRQITIKCPTSKSEGNVKDSRLWMPPSSAVRNLAKNVQCLIKYYLTAGQHFSPLPDFITDGCIKKLASGEVEYHLGDETKIQDINNVFKLSTKEMLVKLIDGRIKKSKKGGEFEEQKSGKRKHQDTPQKGRRRKLKPTASTPKK